MSKIICDVCGTSYPETATQCPICGCVRPVDTNGVSGSTSDSNTSTYKHVKGGRFSKANVQKRNRTSQPQVRNTTAAKLTKENGKAQDKTTAGLVITAIILVLAIIAVAVYISLRFFAPDVLEDPGQLLPPVTTNASAQTEAKQETEATTIACESISLDVDQITFDEINVARMLYATIDPVDTTDVLSFTSSDEMVATVTSDGKVIAVGAGEAVITATCGNVSASCTVICTYVPEEETTVPTTEATIAEEEFMLNRSDITFGKKGESWLLYSGSIGKTEITWSSDDESVATIEGGKVVAVGGGMTNVHAEYNGVKVSCIIRCNFSDESSDQGVTGNGGGVSEDGGGDSGASSSEGCQLYNPYGSAEDVSIKVGESFSLQLMDATGNFVTPTWSVGDSSCCEASGNTFTGKSAGTTSITATYNGETYTCVVRVSG